MSPNLYADQQDQQLLSLLGPQLCYLPQPLASIVSSGSAVIDRLLTRLQARLPAACSRYCWCCQAAALQLRSITIYTLLPTKCIAVSNCLLLLLRLQVSSTVLSLHLLEAGCKAVEALCRLLVCFLPPASSKALPLHLLEVGRIRVKGLCRLLPQLDPIRRRRRLHGLQPLLQKHMYHQ